MPFGISICPALDIAHLKLSASTANPDGRAVAEAIDFFHAFIGSMGGGRHGIVCGAPGSLVCWLFFAEIGGWALEQLVAICDGCRTTCCRDLVGGR
jgi:hypothetical protein